MYDENNIFAKILRKEVPCEVVYEDDQVLFFYDINPQAKVHILGIPKKNVVNFADFILISEQPTVQYFFTKIIDVIKDLGLDQTGYRLVTNNGRDANQEVPHFHIHILAGENLKGIR